MKFIEVLKYDDRINIKFLGLSLYSKFVDKIDEIKKIKILFGLFYNFFCFINFKKRNIWQI